MESGIGKVQRTDLGTTCLEIEVIDRKSLIRQEFVGKVDERTSIICVYDNGIDASLILDENGNAKCNMLSLKFEDVEDNEFNCMQVEHGALIALFLLQHLGETDRLIISCDGGTCRSPAIAAAIMVKLGMDDTIIWENGKFVPNMHVFKTTLVGLYAGRLPSIDYEKRETINIRAWNKLNEV